MKRYKINTRVVETVDMCVARIDRVSTSAVEESATGDWVRWEDVAAKITQLEAQIPELRLVKLERAIGLVSEGKCPGCERNVRDYKAPSGYFAPEGFATLRERGIDPCTGHGIGCAYRGGEKP